eukprot:1161646-Pelagomonas_calceolata.AAC.30
MEEGNFCATTCGFGKCADKSSPSDGGCGDIVPAGGSSCEEQRCVLYTSWINDNVRCVIALGCQEGSLWTSKPVVGAWKGRQQGGRSVWDSQQACTPLQECAILLGVGGSCYTVLAVTPLSD